MTKRELISFLRNHERFNVRGEGTSEDSFAAKLNLPVAITGEELRAMGLVQLIGTFMEDHPTWTAGVNGEYPKRLVLYRRRCPEHDELDDTHCYSCGAWTTYKVARPCTTPGCDQMLEPPIVPHRSSGYVLDGLEDYSFQELQELAALVERFDRLADACNAAIVSLAISV